MVKKVEDLLVKCGKFRLPSKRQLYQPGWEWKVFVVDVGEMEIERPKKQKRYGEWQAKMPYDQVPTGNGVGDWADYLYCCEQGKNP